MKNHKLTQARIKHLFNYRADGNLIRRILTSNCVSVGDVVGCLGNDGRLHSQVDRKIYLNHRLIWLWHKGYFPEHEIDHIDRDKLNNRIENLREVTRTCNLRNTGNRSNNVSGVKGVCWYKRHEKWLSTIRVARKSINLGYHVDFLEAVCHRLAGEQALDWEGCDSSSPAYQYVKKHITG